MAIFLIAFSCVIAADVQSIQVSSEFDGSSSTLDVFLLLRSILSIVVVFSMCNLT